MTEWSTTKTISPEIGLYVWQVYKRMKSISLLRNSLYSKCSRKNKFLHILAVQKLGWEHKIGGRGWEWGGEEHLPANPTILKNLFVDERGFWLVQCGHLEWQV